ncbi:MAG: AAA family ATPase [Planctomycetes bacterium]|nr:AAA family ATPase [Planctomycetota bacterium]
MPLRSNLGRLLILPENRAAFAAIQNVLTGVLADADDLPIPLFLVGPSGSGKTTLVEALTEELDREKIKVRVASANDFADDETRMNGDGADLWIVEDLQHLPMRLVPGLIALLDERQRRGLPMIFTASHGPSQLRHRGKPYPHRLTNRLAGGLVIAIDPLAEASRRRLIDAMAQKVKLNVKPDILDWLAKTLTGGGRQLQGAVRQVKTLQGVHKKPLRLEDVREHFRAQEPGTTPTVQRITERVSGHYHVAPKLVLSARRERAVVLPRQVSMYLARELTDLSLQKIGAYFGGRDHKTVQHACRKIEGGMKLDVALSGAVRQLRAELT